ncbi:hypothetical protein [Sporosarcina sp.]|uniref:hypothetical protein n=1 Tax=Sporosarcina sp. TaxID=49982 RepID=UPI002614A61D|nr:hypothetical protein [Sporosarcina sp.]
MVKEAFSIELNGKISANIAHTKSLLGDLEDSRAFECIDTECKIQLTCTKWKDINGKRIYFTPTSRDHLHIAGCKASGELEEIQRTTFEEKEARKSIKKNGNIVLTRISEQSNYNNTSDKLNDTAGNNTNKFNNNNNENKSTSERSSVTSIMTLIKLMSDPSFDKDKAYLQLPNNEKISINELFMDLDKATLIKKNTLRIFYGKVKVSTYKKTALKIDFVASSPAPLLFTNKSLMLDRHYGKQAKKYIDRNKEIYVFFRGYLSSDNKWKAYNKDFYKDLYFSLEKSI